MNRIFHHCGFFCCNIKYFELLCLKVSTVLSVAWMYTTCALHGTIPAQHMGCYWTRPAPCMMWRHRPALYKTTRWPFMPTTIRWSLLGPWRVTFNQHLFSNGPRRLAFTPPALPTELNWVLLNIKNVWVPKKVRVSPGYKMVVTLFLVVGDLAILC